MRNFQFIGPIDPLQVMIELQRQPELWNADEARRKFEGSPHSQVDDIWVRWERNDLDDGKPREIEFLPSWHKLPALRAIIFALMTRVQAVELGGILITRIPAGGQVFPHVDSGWHAERFNTKVYVALQSNPDCVNFAEEEKVTMNAGDCWIFRNTVSHSVINAGIDDRISAIVCMRCET